MSRGISFKNYNLTYNIEKSLQLTF